MSIGDWIFEIFSDTMNLLIPRVEQPGLCGSDVGLTLPTLLFWVPKCFLDHLVLLPIIFFTE